jgi:exodeoxyribonuclease III
MRLVTQNLRQGGGSRISGLVAFLIKLHADVLVLTEYRNGKTGDDLRRRLTAEGFSHQIVPLAAKGTNAVLLASQLPLTPTDPPPSIPELNRRWLAAAIGGVLITGVYMPATPQELRPFWPRVLEALKSETDKQFVILGDFNTGPTPADRQGSTTFTGEPYMAALIESGWVDAWRRANPKAHEFSWFSNAGNGFRIDHALLSPALTTRPVTARYDHTPRSSGLSDHSALVLNLLE